MSRIGRIPVAIPAGVNVSVQENTVLVKGPKGTLSKKMDTRIDIKIQDKAVVLSATDKNRLTRSLHGLSRSLIANMITGVTQGFSKSLDIVGVGYKADVQGKDLNITVGYSSSVKFKIPEGIQATVQVTADKQTRIILNGCDRELVGQIAANIRRIRKPDPYQGKGVRYTGEKLKIKPGKTATK